MMNGPWAPLAGLFAHSEHRNLVDRPPCWGAERSLSRSLPSRSLGIFIGQSSLGIFIGQSSLGIFFIRQSSLESFQSSPLGTGVWPPSDRFTHRYRWSSTHFTHLASCISICTKWSRCEVRQFPCRCLLCFAMPFISWIFTEDCEDHSVLFWNFTLPAES